MPNRKCIEWDKTDNSALNHKAQLRIKFLPEKPVILDLFCGSGNMYKMAYKEKAIGYFGIDNEKVHDLKICRKMNNLDFILENALSEFNVIDLDDYGSPWKQLYLILRKTTLQDNLTFFITDGLKLHQNIDQRVTKFVSATEQIPERMKIPGLNRWYIDIFLTMLLDLEKRYGWKTKKAYYFFNTRKSVCYWALKLKRKK